MALIPFSTQTDGCQEVLNNDCQIEKQDNLHVSLGSVDVIL